jgi:hypothetical protein
MTNRAPTAVDIIREQHWLELADYLGQKPATIRATMTLWFNILAELGYGLEATGANRQTPRPSGHSSSAAVPEVPYTSLYHAVEEGLLDIANRRSAGERISDQAEVRTIVTNVLACIAETASSDSR